MRALIAIALACCVSIAGAASQPPTPSAAKASAPQQAHPGQPNSDSNSKTKESDRATPALVNVYASPVAQNTGSNQAEKGHEESSWKGVWEALIAIGTLVLAVITGVLAYYTRGLLIEAKNQFPHFVRNVEAGASSADAATSGITLAREDFLSAHRPIIRVRHIWPEGELWTGGAITVTVEVVNSGLTDAAIFEYSIKTKIFPADRPLPIPPHYEGMTPASVSLKSGESTKLISAAQAISEPDHEDIRNGTRRFYCFGYVKYKDGMGRIQTTAFCRVLQILPRSISGAYTTIGHLVPAGPESQGYEYAD